MGEEQNIANGNRAGASGYSTSLTAIILGVGKKGPGKKGPGKKGPVKTVPVKTVLGKNGPGKKGPTMHVIFFYR